jgi:hypothetical protein
MMGKWAWFRKNWWIINIACGVVLVLALWIVNGTLQGYVTPPFLVLFGILFLSMGLEGISSGDIWSAPTLYRDKSPLQFWLLVIMVISLGCVFLVGGIRSLLRGF